MSFLARFESFMEQLVETSLRRVLHASLDITFLKRRLERTMEANQIVVNGKTMVPHYYCVMLNAKDFIYFQKNLAANQSELVDYLEKLALSRSFATEWPIRVEIQQRSFVPLRTLFVETEPPFGATNDEHTSDMPAITNTEIRNRSGITANMVASSAVARSVRFVIEIQNPDGVTMQVPVTTTKITIGRKSSDNIVVLDDHKVSRTHAQITFHARRFQIKDLSSRNGTFVNGKRLSSQAYLLEIDDDTITIAHFSLRIRILDSGDK